MTKAQQARTKRLLPNGVPRWVRCYDNGGVNAAMGSIDRYTVVFTGRYSRKFGSQHLYLGMSASPFYPQGFCQRGEHRQPIDAMDGKWPPAIGRSCHLGIRIRWEDLPLDCQRAAMTDYLDLWDIGENNEK